MSMVRTCIANSCTFFLTCHFMTCINCVVMNVKVLFHCSKISKCQFKYMKIQAMFKDMEKKLNEEMIIQWKPTPIYQSQLKGLLWGILQIKFKEAGYNQQERPKKNTRYFLIHFTFLCLRVIKCYQIKSIRAVTKLVWRSKRN